MTRRARAREDRGLSAWSGLHANGETKQLPIPHLNHRLQGAPSTFATCLDGDEHLQHGGAAKQASSGATRKQPG